MSNTFNTLGLRPELEQAISELGYEQPTPIQSGAIPLLLDGCDVLGQAQTGTGKTAAFSLPMLQILDFEQPGVQGLILTPTRELAIQVSQAVFRYGQHRNVRVLPVYGGQSYTRQISRLKRDTHIVVGTPGRTLDLIRQGVLDLSGVKFLVLDEADEMLKMGFIEDVEAILSATPSERQTALFSATLSPAIRKLAAKYMHSPQEVTIERKTLTVEETEQRYYVVHEYSKLAALTLLLEVEPIESVLIFARTKIGSGELSEKLMERGYTAEALHGDLTQAARETVLRRFRNGQVSILVATDVVARGVDIPHVSHVINYDIPLDPEDYVHRIGRTGRAGRKGVALTLITPRESRHLHAIEQFTRQKITRATLPERKDVLFQRDVRFVNTLNHLLENETFDDEMELVSGLHNAGYNVFEVAAAIMKMARADEAKRPIEEIKEVREVVKERSQVREKRGKFRKQEAGMTKLKMNIGHVHGVRPGDIVGAIAGEAGIPGSAIGAISIEKKQTFVDVESAHVPNVIKKMRKSKLRGQPIQLVTA